MTALDALLAEVEALDEAATKGPWEPFRGFVRFDTNERVDREGLWQILPSDDVERLPLAVVDRERDLDEATRLGAINDAAFIARARTLLPVLREIVRVQSEALGMIREHCTSRHALIAPEIGASAYIIPCDRAEEWLSALARAEALAHEVRDGH